MDNTVLFKAIDHILENNGKPTMLDKPVPNYDRNDSRIPEQVRISFSDGTTAIYVLKVDQPAPLIEENIRIIRKWKQGDDHQQRRRRRCRK